ncbi:MAG: response regulator [Deltaproteobacteria bacterium]|nr:response regulator [Deltaproteobacteria bacterium]
MTKVLIFESDHAFAVELRTELSMLGCTVQVFKEGNTGLAAASQSRPDLVMISADLRPMNGFSICNKLKKEPALQTVPVILMSTDQADEAFEQHKKLRWRADEYVRKPIPMPELVARVRALIPLSGSSSLAPTRIVADAADEGDEAAEEKTISPARHAAPAGRSLTRPGTDEEDENEGITSIHSGPPPESLGPKFLLEQLTDDDGEEATRLGAEAMSARERAASIAPSSAPASSSPPSEQGASVPPPRASIPSSPGAVLPPPAKPLRRRQSITNVLPDEVSPPVGSAPVVPPASAPPLAGQPFGSLASTQILTDVEDLGELDVAASSLPSDAPLTADPSASVMQLRQSLVQAQTELQRLRPQLTELSRARVELADLRRQLGAARDVSYATAGDELTLLRDQLQRRDEELLQLREELTARHRELYDARAQHASSQRELVDLRERGLGLEQHAAEAIARFEAVQAEKSLASRTIDDLKETSRKLAEQLAQSNHELRTARLEHEAELGRAGALRDEAVRAVEEQLRRELSSGDAHHASEVALLRARLAEVEAAAAASMRDLQVSYEAELNEIAETWERRLAQSLEGPNHELAVLGAKHADRIVELEAEHVATLERLRTEYAAEFARRDARSAAELGALHDQLRARSIDAGGHARRADAVAEDLSVAERHRSQAQARIVELEAELRRARDEADVALKSGDSFAAERGALMLAEREARLARDQLAARLATIESTHADVLANTLAAQRSELDEKMRLAIAEAEERLEREAARFEEQRQKLLAEIGVFGEERDEALHSAQSRASRIADLERESAGAGERHRSERAAIEGELERLRTELTDARAGMQRARARSSEDRVALQKARDAISALIATNEPEGDA